MTNTTEFFRALQQGVFVNLNTAMPCKVLAYDETKRVAKIEPLFMVKETGQEPSKLAPIENVPVLFQKYRVNDSEVQNYVPALEPMVDTVLAVFCQRAIDEAMKGNNVYPGTARMFDVHDAVIVGVF
ncbi:Gp138 family membrane-puncturing spike protein [Lysinibacillus sp. NPDC093692]|uniref:Gp138 family membrane-puncturing spike protein n=1 Tax=Lysinibacillus sp. NPDC093692 TaxID=3390578 RepID=UPI003D08C83A